MTTRSQHTVSGRQHSIGSTDTAFRFGELTLDRFMNEHWRRAPLHVKNGAKSFIDLDFDSERFENLKSALPAEAISEARSRDGQVVFVENIDRTDAELQFCAQHLAAQLGLPTAWFDAVQTQGISGIGAHFDHSDNFVMQKEGCKTWSISPPDSLPEHAIARRMLGDPEVGAATIDTSTQRQFILEPGDLLYLPLFWIHDGISSGPSLSLSLVCPAVPLKTLLLQSLRAEMDRRGLGYAPAPVCPPSAGKAATEHHLKTLALASEHLLKRLLEEGASQRLAEYQIRYLNSAAESRGVTS